MKVPIQMEKSEMKMKLMHSCGLSKLSADIQDPIQWCHESRRSIEKANQS